MNYPTKEEVFEACGVRNGRELKINHFVTLLGEYRKLDKETQKEILSMIPGYQAKMLEAYSKYEEFSTKVLVSNDESERRVYDLNEKALQSINEELRDPNITEEQKNSLYTQREKILSAVSAKDSEGKKFRMQQQQAMFGGLVLVGGGAIYLLSGGKINPHRV